MSTAPAVTMRELELETAELLPPRETLYSGGSQAGSGSAGSHHDPGGTSGSGNTSQSGTVNVSAGNCNNDGSAGSGSTG
jgi:hypothetical protein